MFQDQFKEVSILFHGNFKGASCVLQHCLKMVIKCLIGVSRMFQGCFNKVARSFKSSTEVLKKIKTDKLEFTD